MATPNPPTPPTLPPAKLDYFSPPSSRKRRFRLGTLPTAILMLILLLPLACMIIGKDGPFFYVISGQLFRDRFDPVHAGTVLDQPTIGKWYILSAFFSFISLCWMTLIRLVSRRSTLGEHLAYALPAAATCLLLLIMLMLPFWWNIQYITTMGYTPTRLKGLILGSLAFLSLLAFLVWFLRRRAPMP